MTPIMGSCKTQKKLVTTALGWAGLGPMLCAEPESDLMQCTPDASERCNEEKYNNQLPSKVWSEKNSIEQFGVHNVSRNLKNSTLDGAKGACKKILKYVVLYSVSLIFW